MQTVIVIGEDNLKMFDVFAESQMFQAIARRRGDEWAVTIDSDRENIDVEAAVKVQLAKSTPNTRVKVEYKRHAVMGPLTMRRIITAL